LLQNSGWSCSTDIGYGINTSNWCTATLLYADYPNCNTAAPAGWYTTGAGINSREWNGSAFVGGCFVTNCE
jgi:hypothetical protein